LLFQFKVIWPPVNIWIPKKSRIHTFKHTKIGTFKLSLWTFGLLTYLQKKGTLW
jgi:hypothetical protein